MYAYLTIKLKRRIVQLRFIRRRSKRLLRKYGAKIEIALYRFFHTLKTRLRDRKTNRYLVGAALAILLGLILTHKLGHVAGELLWIWWQALMLIYPYQANELQSSSSIFTVAVGAIFALVGIVYAIFVYFHQRLTEQTNEYFRAVVSKKVKFHLMGLMMSAIALGDLGMAIYITHSRLPLFFTLLAIQIIPLGLILANAIKSLDFYQRPIVQINIVIAEYRRLLERFENRYRKMVWANEANSREDKLAIRLRLGMDNQNIWNRAKFILSQIFQYAEATLSKGDLNTAEAILEGIPIVLLYHFSLQTGTLSNTMFPFDNLPRLNNDDTLTRTLENYKVALGNYVRTRDEHKILLLQRSLFSVANACLSINYLSSNSYRLPTNYSEAVLTIGYLRDYSAASAMAGMPDVTMAGLRGMSNLAVDLIQRNATVENLLGIASDSNILLLGARTGNQKVVEGIWVDHFYYVILATMMSKINDYHLVAEDYIRYALEALTRPRENPRNVWDSISPTGIDKIINSLTLNEFVRQLQGLRDAALDEINAGRKVLIKNLLRFLDSDRNGWYRFIRKIIENHPALTTGEFDALHRHIRSICGLLSFSVSEEDTEYFLRRNSLWSDWFALYTWLYNKHPELAEGIDSADEFLDIANWLIRINFPNIQSDFLMGCIGVRNVITQNLQNAFNSNPTTPPWREWRVFEDVIINIMLGTLLFDDETLSWTRGVVGTANIQTLFAQAPQVKVNLKQKLRGIITGTDTGNYSRRQQSFWVEVVPADVKRRFSEQLDTILVTTN